MNGILLADKPAGVTSHDVVAGTRRRLGRGIKVGHAGTLDPFATGLLVVLVGRGTRVQRFVMELPKAYEVVARFGWVSSTGDPEGELTFSGVVPEGDLDLPVGTLSQRPPAYSAIKVGGKRAYALARAGAPVVLPSRSVTVYRFEELWRDGSDRGFLIECGSGTYVRSLIADLGDAYCLSLRRTRIGQFDVADAGDRLIGLEEALSFIPAVAVGADAAERIAHGRRIEVPAAGIDPGSGVVRVVDDAGLVCLAEAIGGAAGEVELRAVVGLRG